MENKNKVYGIDLGTTYSCIATIDEFNKPVIMKNSEGKNVTPSVVFYEDQDSIIVGETAKDALLTDWDSTVALIKREIGNDNYVSACKYPESPSMVSSYILKKLVKDANETLGEEVKDVVITCPAYFGTKERMQTKQAGEIAGLNVLAIINEPTAAALSYGMSLDQNKVVLVYDLGGGTFDITMIEVKSELIKVIATGGDHRLGGADWDKALARYFADEFASNTGITDNLFDDLETKNTLLATAERAKQMLSSKASYKAKITYGGTSYTVEVTREKFDELTSHLLSQTISLTREMLEEAGKKGYTHFDEILLVGGSSRMPQVKRAIDEEFGVDAALYEPDEAVAKGAAIFAMDAAFQKAIGGEGEEEGHKPKIGGATEKAPKTIVNVLSKTYGVGCVTGENLDIEVISNMVFQQTELPVKVTKSFYPTHEGQERMPLEVFESSATDEMKQIPRTDGVLQDGRMMDFPHPLHLDTEVQVTFDLNAEGILTVYGYEKQTGARCEFNMKINGVLSPEELKKAAKVVAMRSVE